MKKIVAVLSIFILLFVTGCGNTVSEINVDNTKSIIETDLKNMQEVDEDSLKDVYGFAPPQSYAYDDKYKVLTKHIIESNKVRLI